RALAPVRRSVAGRRKVALEVHGDNGIPLVLGHVHEHPVAEDPGVVDEDVEPAELVDRLPDEPFRSGEIRHGLPRRARFSPRVAAVRGRSPPWGGAPLGALLRGAGVGASAGASRAGVVAHALGSGGREGGRVRAADATSGPVTIATLPVRSGIDGSLFAFVAVE